MNEYRYKSPHNKTPTISLRLCLCVFNHLSRNDHTLNLRCALVDLIDLGIAEQLLDGVLGVETVAAEDLDGIGGASVGHIGAVQFGNGSVVAVAAA